MAIKHITSLLGVVAVAVTVTACAADAAQPVDTAAVVEYPLHTNIVGNHVLGR
ncbi:hypothetical protein P9209_20255 [Prescottella defluvii]|nr:hypothetical protein P9209_20255 [Prescottella defluvii]